MREREINEFESLFKRAIIPAIEVDKIEITEIALLADETERTGACIQVANELTERFGANVVRHNMLKGDPIAHLQRITEARPSLILAPAPLHLADGTPRAEALGHFIDMLLVSTAVPTLLIRGPVEGSIFHRILAKIPSGRADLIEQFSFAFALCNPGGSIRLLHVVDRERLKALGEVLEITPGIDDDDSEELLKAIDARMDHLLRGAVRMADDAAFEVDGHIELGDPFVVLPQQAVGCSLLIVGSQTAHTEFLDSRAYELIRRVPHVPVLAL